MVDNTLGAFIASSVAQRRGSIVSALLQATLLHFCIEMIARLNEQKPPSKSVIFGCIEKFDRRDS